MNDQTNQDGEIIEQRGGMPASLVDMAGLSTIVRAELDAQIVTAKQFPRSIQRVIGNITTLATLDEDTAEECLYALVRKKKQRSRNAQANQQPEEENKPIEGPSIRLAEIAAQCYGNCRIEARVIAVNRVEKYVEAEGIFLDLETNMASKATVRRRISTSGGYLFSDDMINVTSNAACAIAKRNAVLAGIPRGVYRPAYAAARKIVAGTAETLSANRDKAIKAFATFGVTPEQIFEALGVDGEREIKTDHIATLRAMFVTLKNGEETVESMFGKHEADHKVVENPLNDEIPDHDKKGEEGDQAGKDAGTEASAKGSDKKPAEGDKPAAEGKQAEGGKAAKEKPAKAAEEAKDERTPEQIAAAIDAAYARGEEAKAKGMTPKSMPAEFKAKDRQAEADAWNKGFKGEALREPGEEG